jgi:hypothetical protein
MLLSWTRMSATDVSSGRVTNQPSVDERNHQNERKAWMDERTRPLQYVLCVVKLEGAS